MPRKKSGYIDEAVGKIIDFYSALGLEQRSDFSAEGFLMEKFPDSYRRIQADMEKENKHETSFEDYLLENAASRKKKQLEPIISGADVDNRMRLFILEEWRRVCAEERLKNRKI